MARQFLCKGSDSRLFCGGCCCLFAHVGNRCLTGYEASLSCPSTKAKRDKFAVLKRAPRHDGFAQNTQMNFRDDVNFCGEHVPGVGLEVVIGKRGVEMSERLSGFTASEVTLKSHKFGPPVEGHPVIDVIVVHVAVHAVSRSPYAAGYGGGIEAHFIGQSLKRGVNLFSRVEANKHIVVAAGPLHEHGLSRQAKRVPFIHSRWGRKHRFVLVPSPECTSVRFSTTARLHQEAAGQTAPIRFATA